MPLMRTWLAPSATAVVASAPTSEPAAGSVSAKAAIRWPAQTPGRYFAFSASLPNSDIGSAAKALHRESKIGKSVLPGENLTGQAEFAEINSRRRTAVTGGNNSFQPSGMPQCSNKRPACLIDIGVIGPLREVLACPLVERRSELSMQVVKKRPSKMRKVDHGCFASVGREFSAARSRSLKRWILPVEVFGSASTNSIQRGYFHGPTVRLTCVLRPS